MKYLIYIASNFPVRHMTLLFMKIMKLISRIVSNLKFYAITTTKKRVICHWSAEIKYPNNISYAEGIIIGPKCTLGAKSNIIIGNNVRLSKGVYLETAGLDFSKKAPYPHVAHKIVLEDNVWLGANVMILGGVTVGENSIIGASTVVTKDVPANSIVVSASNRIIERKKDK